MNINNLNQKQMKAKILKRTLLLAAMLLACAVQSRATDFEYNGLTYTILTDNTCETKQGSYSNRLIAGNSISGNLVIPETVYYNGKAYSVTTIGMYAFSNCSGLTEVSIPNSVTTMGSYAFYGCSGLTSVSIPNSVTKIGFRVFYYCTGLTEVTIPNSVILIGESAFEGCTGLTSVSIPNSVTKIGSYAFKYCTGLTDVTIPSSVISIGESAFYGCTGLKWIESQAVTPPTIQSDTFSGYSIIPLLAASEDYKVADYWKKFTTIAAPYTPTGTTFEVDGLKYEIISINDLTCRLYAIDETVTGVNVVIPETVVYKNRTFTPIEIPGVLIKGESSIRSLSIPSCATTIPTGIMYGTSLEKLIVNASISNNLAYNLNIDELVITPSSSKFSNGLSTNSIGKITIEDSETELTTTQFECNNTKEVYLGRNVSASTFKNMTTLEKVTISDKVTSIGEDAFRGCTGLTELTIPNSVTEIGRYAFYGCKGITSLNFEDGESELAVNYYAFDNEVPTKAYFGRQMNFSRISVSAFETVEFGENVTSIESGAFKDGTAIRTVVSRNATPPTTDDTFSNDTYLEGELYVPKASIETYQAAAGWKNFWEVKPLSEYSGVEGVVVDEDVETISVDNGAISVSGNVPVRIVALNGTTVYSGRGEARVNVAPGIYVVIAGNKAHKVAIR
jgi:hypothetical protein